MPRGKQGSDRALWVKLLSMSVAQSKILKVIHRNVVNNSGFIIRQLMDAALSVGASIVPRHSIETVPSDSPRSGDYGTFASGLTKAIEHLDFLGS